MSPLRALRVARRPSLLVSAALCAFAAPKYAAAEQLALKTYGVADGLPQEGVKRILRDSRGFLWFCTYDGLSRFDGTRFVNYDVGDGLPHPSLNDIIESHRGVYWIATNGGGVARFDPAMTTGSEPDRRLFTPYAVGTTPATARVNVRHEDRAGRVWAGTDDGLFVVDAPPGPIGFRPVDLPFARPVQVWALLEDRAGSMWVGTSAGLARHLPDGKVQIVRVDSNKEVAVWALAEDDAARLWVGLSTRLRVVSALSGSGRSASAPGIEGRISALHASGG